MDDTQHLPPFLRLPLEIRLQIYSHLLISDSTTFLHDPNLSHSQQPSYVDYHEYEKDPYPASPAHNRVLSFRNIGPPHFTPSAHAHKLRSTYKIRAGRLRAQCTEVTYACVNRPTLHTAVLGASRQVHAEAARLLYSSYTFDFDSHVESCIPFLGDLTPYSRGFVRRMSVVKKALPYEKDFDRCEWENMCRYVAEELSLVSLSLGVVAGKPSGIGWEAFKQIPEAEFDVLVNIAKRDEMQWVRDLMVINGLQKLEVRPIIEHCPAPPSEAMMFFVVFSASVASGLTQYLQKRLIRPQVKA